MPANDDAFAAGDRPIQYHPACFGSTEADDTKDVKMKSLIIALGLTVAAAGLAPMDTQAKRLGGGGSSGMKRDMPARTAPDATPAKPAAPAAAPNTAGAAPQAAPKRSWMGPLAGLAAGLGIAALMSHLGMGEAFADFLMLALLAVVAVVAIRFLLRRFGPAAQRSAAPQGMQFAGGAAGNGSVPLQGGGTGSGFGNAGPTTAPAANYVEPATVRVPADFDAAAFERIAKMIFIRLQAANDTADLNDLRTFTTPELFASIRLELQERGNVTQQTDVVKIDAEVVDFATEAGRQLVSVRFHGLIREEKDGAANPFDEIWHLVKPIDGGQAWAIAGIQQTA
jgi:predicted lipid-binding transport protein (Tim44 family)